MKNILFTIVLVFHKYFSIIFVSFVDKLSPLPFHFKVHWHLTSLTIFNFFAFFRFPFNFHFVCSHMSYLISHMWNVNVIYTHCIHSFIHTLCWFLSSFQISFHSMHQYNQKSLDVNVCVCVSVVSVCFVIFVFNEFSFLFVFVVLFCFALSFYFFLVYIVMVL